VLILGTWGIVGLVTIIAAYRGTADLALVVLQLPYVLSGGLGGIAIVGISLGLASVHFDRVESIEERRELAQLHKRMMQLTKTVAERRSP
jgi:hypothetical protein